MNIKIKLVIIFLMFIEKIKCIQNYINSDKNICYKFLYMNYYIRCIITNNKYKITEKCLNHYGDNIYNLNSTLPYDSIDLKYCDKFNNNNEFILYEKTATNLYNCFLKINKLRYKYKNVNCNKFKHNIKKLT